MISYLISWLPGIPQWLTFETTPLDSFLQGLVGACGISIVCNLLRVHLFVNSVSNSEKGNSEERTRQWNGANGRLSGTLQFWFTAGILAMVGSRVASLVVLEFSLRAALAKKTAGKDSQPSSTQQFLIQCQFSLGCALSCSLHFLQEGAPQRTFSLLLAAGLSWLLASQCVNLWHHVMKLYQLHSSQRYCGMCIGLLASGSTIITLLCRAVMLTFAVAAFAGISIVNRHFQSASEALRFWTPLTICYTLLVIHMQEEQHHHPGAGTMLQTVVVRLGGLLVLMLTMGHWSDVLHILVCLLGEAGCLIPTRDLLDAVLQDMDGEIPSKAPKHIRENQRRELVSLVTPKKKRLSSSHDVKQKAE